MEWKKVNDTNDLVVYEKEKKGINIRIEARCTDDGWEIYKNYINEKKSDFVEEFFAGTKEEADSIISKLMNKKDLSPREIRELTLQKNQKIRVNIQRAYKDINVEKWTFSVNGEHNNNFVVVRFGDSLDVDIVLEKKYVTNEIKITEDLMKSLGIEDMPKDIFYNVYYFVKKNSYESIRRDFLDKIDSEDDDESLY